MISNSNKENIKFREGCDVPEKHRACVLSEGEELIEKGRYEEIDGCLGDQGCHMRAIITTLLLGLRIISAKPDEFENYIINMVILGKITNRLITENGMFLEEKTKEDLPDCLAKDKDTTQRKKGKIIYQARSNVAKFAISQLKNLVSLLPDDSHHPRFNCDLKTALLDSFDMDQKQLCLPQRENEDIPCLPYMTAGLSILETLVNAKVGLFVMVKRYKINNENQIEFEDCSCLPYEVIDGKFCYIQNLPDDKYHVPHVTFEFYSFYHESDADIKSFQRHIESLTQMDIYDLIMMNWSVHGQYPHVRHEDSIPSYVAETGSDLNKIYEDYKEKATKFQITQEKIFVRTGKNSYSFNLKDAELPWFTLNHIYCSTYASRLKVMEDLRNTKHPFLPKNFTYTEETPGFLNLEKKINAQAQI